MAHTKQRQHGLFSRLAAATSALFGRTAGVFYTDAFLRTGAQSDQFGSLTVLDQEGYVRTKDLVLTCITVVAEALTEGRLEIVKGQSDDPSAEVVTNHVLQPLVENPSATLGRANFWYAYWQHFLSTGFTLAEQSLDAYGVTESLIPWPTSNVTLPQGDQAQAVAAAYDIQDPATGKTHRALRKNCVVDWVPDPGNLYRATSPMQAAAAALAVDAGTDTLINEVLTNSPITGMIVTQDQWTELDRAAAEQRLMARIGSSSGGRGRPLLLEGEHANVKIVEPPRDFDSPSLRGFTESRICMVFRVPPIIVGARVGLENSPWSNFGEARRTFFQNLRPLWKRCADAWTRNLLRDVGDDTHSFRFSVEHIPELQEDMQVKSTTVSTLVGAGVWTVNEAREYTGRPPIAGGDVRQVAMSTQELPIGDAESDDAEQPDAHLQADE